MADLLALGVFLFLVGVVTIVILGLAYSSRRDRAVKAERIIGYVLAYAEPIADVETYAQAVIDIIEGGRRAAR